MNKAQSISNQGFSLVEVLLAVSIFGLLVMGLVGGLIFGQQATSLAGARSRAVMLAEEGLEATRNLRDASYANLTNGNHGLQIAADQWGFSGTSDTTDSIFTRQIVISDAEANRKNVTSTVTWQQNPQRTGSVTLTTMLTNWLGTKKGLAPSLFGTFDLTAANSGSDVADAISLAAQASLVYLGRDVNPGNEFFVIDVSDPANPSLSGQLGLGGTPNDIAVSGNYAYIASADNYGELTVVNISNPASPTIAATFDLTAANSGSANSDALAVAIGQTNYLYLTRTASGGKEFYVFDISTPASPSLAGSIDLNGNLNEIVSTGSYAFAASSDDSQEFQIINVTSVSSPALAASLDLDQGSPSSDGFSVAAGTNTAYLGRDGSPGGPEFYIIDTTTLTSPSITSYLDIGTLVLKSIDYSADANLVFFSNKNPAEDDYNTIDVSTPSTPTLLTSVNLDDEPNKLVYEPIADKVYIASGSNTQELQIIAP